MKDDPSCVAAISKQEDGDHTGPRGERGAAGGKHQNNHLGHGRKLAALPAGRARGEPQRDTDSVVGGERPIGDSITPSDDLTSQQGNSEPQESEDSAIKSLTGSDERLTPLEAPPEPTAAERQVADLIQIETDPVTAAAVLDRVPLWFHTFSLDRSTELYTHGVARDHRYRVPALPEDFGGMSVLDIGTFDGFYAFLAEARGAGRVVAIDNEQYREWVSSRWGVELQGGEGFAAIRELLNSEVDYQRIDAFDLDELEETFDFIFCFGILHRVENPLGLLKIIRRRLAAGGRVLLETHGAADRTLDSAAVHIPVPGEVYARDDFVYWGFTPAGLDAMARHAGFEGFELIDTPVIDGHPRVLGALLPGPLD
jgi:tRNA (mo5U34)-methyltransferase